MGTQEVITETQIKQRLLDLEEQNRKLQQELLEERKNTNFTQTYPKGWERIRNLIQSNPGAARLYSVLSEHIDGSCGAVVADQQFLADQLSVTTRTIRNWVNFLEENRCLVRIPVAGKLCAYALDPAEVWKGYNTSKPYAAFLTKTLVNSERGYQTSVTSMLWSIRAGIAVKERRAVKSRSEATLDGEVTPHWQRWKVNRVSLPPVKPPFNV